MRAHAGIRARQVAASARRHARGLTLIEVLIVLAILGVLAGAAIPKFYDYRERIRVQHAVAEIAALNVSLRNYMLDNNHQPPPGLDAINAAGTLDPWGASYVYFNVRTAHGHGGGR